MALSILLTNDDGPESPLLVPFAEAIAAAPWCRELRVVVPARERSWIGKAITKFDPLVVTPRVFGSVDGHAVATESGSAGTPADCVELGLWNLYPDRADFVLSGINMGTNAGLAFALSSGTIGGALEATLNGVGAMAVSAHLPAEIFAAWSAGEASRPERDAVWARLAHCAVDLCGSLLASEVPKRAPILSINLPYEANPETPVRLTCLRRTAYRGVFAADPADPTTFRHRFPGFSAAPGPETSSPLPSDLDVLARGEISVSAFGELVTTLDDTALVERIERD